MDIAFLIVKSTTTNLIKNENLTRTVQQLILTTHHLTIKNYEI